MICCMNCEAQAHLLLVLVVLVVSRKVGRTGPLIGEGTTAQRMIGILLWRT